MLSANSDSVKSFHESFYGTPTTDEPRRRRGKRRHPVAKEEPQNEVAVVGVHYRSFDDDVMAAFVNSATALVAWNGDPKLLIDRYDVRHLLLDLTGIRRRRARPPSPDATKEELDYERYRDLEGLENTSPAEDGQAMDGSDAGGYQRVGFDYASDMSASLKRVEEADFTPPFFVPENLRASIPTSTKLHQIMAGTAKYVIEHGGQAEIVLRVKQANNPIFGFLMPDHQDHEYFRFLVAHPEHVGIASESQPIEVAPVGKIEVSGEDTEGGLSLLGTAYAASDDDVGEEEEAGPSLLQTKDEQIDVAHEKADIEKANDTVKESEGQQETGNPPGDDPEAVTQPEGAEGSQAGVDEARRVEEPPPPGMIEPNVLVPDNAAATDPVTELPYKDPPVQVGLIIDKMVEFISRNGKEFEAIVRERDKANQRFPFFLPWNEYHPYYSEKLKAAREAQTEGGENAASDTLVGEASGIKPDQVMRKEFEEFEDSFLIGVPFWDESLAGVVGDDVRASVIDSGEVSTLQSDGADQEYSGDGGMSFDAVLAAVRAATRGRQLNGDCAEGAEFVKSSEIMARPEIGSDEAVLAAIRSATRRSKPDSPVVSASKEEDAHGALLDVPAIVAPTDSASLSTSGPDARLDSAENLVIQTSQVANVEGNRSPNAASPLASRVEAFPEVEVSPSAKRKAERLKKAKLFAAMIKEKNVSHPCPGLPAVPAGAPELAERLNLAVAASGNGNDADENLIASTEVEAEKRDLIGTAQPVDVQMQQAQDADKGVVGVKIMAKKTMEDRDREQGQVSVKHLQTRKEKERRGDRENGIQKEKSPSQDHHQELRKVERKHGRHQHDTDDRAVDETCHHRVTELREKAEAKDEDGNEDEDHRKDRSHRDREHKRKRESKSGHGEKPSRRHGLETSASRREKRHGQDTEKTWKETRYRVDSVEDSGRDDRRDNRYGQGHSQDLYAERREGKRRYTENKDSSRRRHDSEEREMGRRGYEEDKEETRMESSHKRSRRRKQGEGSSDDGDERQSRRRERRSKKSRRRDADGDEGSRDHKLEVRKDTSMGRGLESSDPVGGNGDKKPLPPGNPALSSADIPDDIRAKVRAMLAMV